jgi:hypothetical protein
VGVGGVHWQKGTPGADPAWNLSVTPRSRAIGGQRVNSHGKILNFESQKCRASSFFLKFALNEPVASKIYKQRSKTKNNNCLDLQIFSRKLLLGERQRAYWAIKPTGIRSEIRWN